VNQPYTLITKIRYIDMRKAANLLSYGESHFGSGCYNTEEFHEFFDLFKRSFTRELKCVGATDIEFSKGHFYLSGFFTVNHQAYYFSLSDVRSQFSNPEKLLVRTADSYKDYTGGHNNYFKIQSGMSQYMANNWGFTYNKAKSSNVKTSTEIAQKIIDSKVRYHEFSVPSNNKALDIMFSLMKHFTLEAKDTMVTTRKYGRFIDSSNTQNKHFEAYYYTESKRIRIVIKGVAE